MERIVETHDTHPLRTVERHVVETVAPLTHPQPRNRQPRVETSSYAERHYGIGAPLAVGIPVERLINQRQTIRGLPGGLHEIVGHLVPEEHENILLTKDIYGLSAVTARRSQTRCAVYLRIAVDIRYGALHLPIRRVLLVRREVQLHDMSVGRYPVERRLRI